MSHAMVADRYARALLELGLESQQLEALARQVAAVADAYSGSVDLRRVTEDPVVSAVDRDSVLRQVADRLGAGEWTRNAVLLLAARRKLRILPELARRLSAMVDEHAGVTRAVVTSALPLTEAQYAQIAEQLARITRRHVIIERQQDPSLIAGVVTRLGDDVIDGSLRGRLKKLEQQLLHD